MLRVRSRQSWGARAPRCGYGSFSQKAAYTFIHHSVTSVANVHTVAEEKAHMRYLQEIALSRDFCDISYSFVVFPSGRVYEGRGWKAIGAHTEGFNDDSHAFCFAGNYEVAVPTTAALRAAGKLHARGKRKGFIARVALILGHRDAVGAQTACPGKYLWARLHVIKRASR